MGFTIEITQRVVSYRAEQCRYAEEEGHAADGGPECTGECTELDGDSRELESPSTWTVTADDDDMEEWDGSVIEWASDYITTKTDAKEPSLSPIGDRVPEHCWLSGQYEDPHKGDAHVTETTVRLIGDWSPEQRSAVFTAARAGV